jgi:hypothetical protein
MQRLCISPSPNINQLFFFPHHLDTAISNGIPRSNYFNVIFSFPFYFFSGIVFDLELDATTLLHKERAGFMPVLIFPPIPPLLLLGSLKNFWYTLHYFLQITRIEKSVEIKMAPLYVCILYCMSCTSSGSLQNFNYKRNQLCH